MAKISLAGPVANLIAALVLEILTVILLIFVSFPGALRYIPTVLEVGAWINAGLGFFNLIPVPPQTVQTSWMSIYLIARGMLGIGYNDTDL